MIRVVIVDDEASARRTIKNLLRLNCPGVKVVGEADGVDAGVELVQRLSPDVLFLDIKMNERSGFDLLDEIPEVGSQVIFTTAYDNFALRAFQYNAVDYLLKPIDPDKLVESVRRAENRQMPQAPAEQIKRLLKTFRQKDLDKIALSTSEGLIFLKLEDIVRLEATNNYTTFYTSGNQKIVVSKTIREFESLLPADTFSRTHQSHIVNLDYVRKVLKEDGGYAVTEDNVKIPISRRKKDAFIDALTRRSLQ